LKNKHLALLFLQIREGKRVPHHDFAFLMSALPALLASRRFTVAITGRNIMNRRTFTTTALLGLAVATALPQASFAQTSPLIGTWKLNLAKSKYSPGPPPRSGTAIWEAAGQGFRTRAEGIDAQGKLDELQKGNPIAWREAGVNARPRFGFALR
jgi:hypothetical protein